MLHEAETLRALREVAIEVCVKCEIPRCKGGPDCDYRSNVKADMPLWLARKTRAEAWRKIISDGRRAVPRDDARTKGKRLLAEARVRILECSEDDAMIAAEIRGDSSRVYVCGHEPDTGWHCSCRAYGRCSHVIALQLVTVMEPRA